MPEDATVTPHDHLPAGARSIDALDTPAVLIDLDRVEANIATAQAYADRHGLALRPHVKTHKLPALAHRQLAAGAVGITAQKISEALVMAHAGVDDILLTFPIVGAAKVEPLAQLARATRRLAVMLDNQTALEHVARAAASAATTIEIVIEFESGNRRTGVMRPEQARALARAVDAADGVALRGLGTHPLGDGAAAWVREARSLLAQDGIEAPVFSGGGTPTMWQAHRCDGLNELRVGTYVYHDRATVGAGAATLDACALQVLATVVSTPERDRAVIDAGSKTLTSDRLAAAHGEGHGLVLAYPGALITSLSEEHGVLDLSACEARPHVGDRLLVVPNHACPVTNLDDHVVAQRGGRVEWIAPVWARGATR